MSATVDPDPHEPPGALSPAAVLEVLAYLVTAARTQVDEAAEYGPMRLLTAAQRIAEHLRESTASAGPAVGGLVGELRRLQPTATPTRDRQDYVDRLDHLCELVADALLASLVPDEGAAS